MTEDLTWVYQPPTKSKTDLNLDLQYESLLRITRWGYRHVSNKKPVDGLIPVLSDDPYFRGSNGYVKKIVQQFNYELYVEVVKQKRIDQSKRHGHVEN